MATANVTVKDDCIIVLLDGCTFEFREIALRGGKFDTELTVKRPPPTDPVDLVDYDPNDPSESFTAHLNGKSLSSVEAFRRAVQNVFGKGVAWERIFQVAIRQAEEAYKNAVVAFDPDKHTLQPAGGHLVEGVLPEGQLSCMFGLGEAAKSLIALSLCHAIGGDFPWMGRRVNYGRTLWVDAENPRIEEFARRRNRLTLGINGQISDKSAGTIRWLPTKGMPMTDMVPVIKREMLRHKPKLVVVDSAGFVCGGNPNDPDTATRTTNALLSLGCTVLLIAHTTKAEDDRMPFGSSFWHYAIHGKSWFLKKAGGEEHPDEFDIGLYLRKRSDGPRPPDFAVHLSFDGDAGPIELLPGDIDKVNRETGRLSAAEKILAVLGEGPLKPIRIGEEAGLETSIVRGRLKELKDKGKVQALGDGTYALTALGTGP